jgi:tRNA(Ile)-lysidine synthase
MLQPCLIRACTPLIEAEQIAQAATLAIGQAQNWQDLQTIEDQFDQAQTLLDQVPWWSQYHDQAVELGQRYEDALASFEPIIQAFEQAIEAVNKSQDPPHSIETWQVAQNLWTEAISQLEAITPDNPTYPLAQLKHRQYQGYLEAVGRQLQREQEARQTLENAEQSATLARNHQEDARSLAAWRNARSHWEIAIRALDSISRETTAFLIAQERLKIYHAKLAEVEDGESDTLFASNLYNQALDKAQEAKAAEAAYQWDRAAMRWQVALAAMQKIPQESDYYDRAQDQIENYMSALWQAQLQAQGQNLFGQIQQELGEICAGVPTICHFEISKELITVHLTLEYEQAVLSAGVLGDEQSQAEALDKLQALETALESMSDRSQMPLELYDPDGTLVGTHTPSSNQPDHEQPDHKQPDQPLNQVDRELWTPLHARLHQTLRQRSLLPPGQRLLIGVSGGQDSLCLLRLIWDLCSKWHWSLGVIHCDHGWAGDQQTAQAVERYVQRCYGLELYQRQAPIALPSEGKARQWRYQMFQEVALAQGFDRVLTAHTASDRAETLLHHLLRGSGMDGLSSLPWQRDLGQRKWERGCAALPPQFLQESNGRENRGENRGKTLLLVRPLLNFSRAETGKFCRDQHIPVWQDPHNDDRRHTRNRIRLDLLPYLQQQFNPQTERHLAQTVELLAADVAYLEQQAEILRQQVVVDAPPGLKRLPLQTAPLALQRRVVRQFLRDQLPHHPNFAQIEKVVQLIHAPNRCQTDPLSGGAIAQVQGDQIILVTPQLQ